MGDNVEKTEVQPEELAKSLDESIQSLAKSLDEKTEQLKKSATEQTPATEQPSEEANEQDEIDKADSAYWEGRKNGGDGVFDQGRTGSKANRSVRQYGRSVRTIGIGSGGDMQKSGEETGRSLAEHVAQEGGEEAASAIDISDFLYGLTKGIDNVITEIGEKLHTEIKKSYAKIAAMENTLDLHSKLMVAQGNLNKSMADKLTKYGEQVEPSTSLIKSGKPRFALPNNPQNIQEAMEMKKSLLQKSIEAVQSKKMEPLTAMMVEERLNAGLPLEPEWLQQLGVEEKE